MSIAGRELKCVAERGPTPRHDADLVNWVGVLAVGRHDRMTGLVIRDPALFDLSEPAALLLG